MATSDVADRDKDDGGRTLRKVIAIGHQQEQHAHYLSARPAQRIGVTVGVSIASVRQWTYAFE